LVRLYLLAIPVIIGIVAAIFISSLGEKNDEPNLLTVKNLIENGSPVLGNHNAPITILEWGDYQCTYCYRFHKNSLDIIIEEYVETGKTKIVFKDFPLNGPDSILAAEAAYCAEDQGKYWQYHDELYENWGGERTGWVTRSSLNEFAKTVELDLIKFNSCLDNHKYKTRVLELEKFGKEIGIDATPSFLIFNNEKIVKIRGNQPLEVFKKALDEM
jgi:protein-disulfide isomerase